MIDIEELKTNFLKQDFDRKEFTLAPDKMLVPHKHPQKLALNTREPLIA